MKVYCGYAAEGREPIKTKEKPQGNPERALNKAEAEVLYL
jgi:hypothetical protein